MTARGAAIIRCRARSRGRRATLYLFFLTTAMLVAIIGLTALSVVRVQTRAAEGVNQAAVAERAAQSAAEQGLLAIFGTAKWRDSITQGAWSTTQSVGSGALSWKIVDPVNGNLTTDRNAPVRVYGRGSSGDALWLYSVQVQPPLESTPANLLTNGNLESGAVSPWWGTACSLKLDATTRHGGTNSLVIWQRTVATFSANQTIATKIQPNLTYRVQVWIRTRTSAETINVGVQVTAAAGSAYYTIAQVTGGTSWQLADGMFTPTWNGTLTDAYLQIAGTSGAQEILIDDARLFNTPAVIGVIPGTWRREAN